MLSHSYQHQIQQPGRGGRAKKHEIYVAAFGGHFFMTYLYRVGEGGYGPLGTRPGSATAYLAQNQNSCGLFGTVPL